MAILLTAAFAACSKKEAEDDLSKYLQEEEIVEKVKLANGDVFYIDPVDTTTVIVTRYEGSHELHAVSIPDKLAGKRVVGIGDQAFYYCNNVTAVEIPSTVTSIGRLVFSGCSFLEGISLPASVKTIGDGAFYECTSLAELTFAEDGALEEIPDTCFWGCTALKSVTIPSYVNRIGKGAFYGCKNLSTLTVEDSETPIEIKDQAFQNLENLKTVYLPENAVYTSLSFAGTAWEK